MSRVLFSDYAASADIPSINLSAAEKVILAMPSLRGWWEADHRYSRHFGGRWVDKRFGVPANTFNKLSAPREVVSGISRLRFGYDAGTAFSGTDRGAMVPAYDHPLISAAGFTVFSVQRVPTVASAESGTVGGYTWSSRGVSGNALPGLNISGSTGQAAFRAGGVLLSNPGFDLRDGLLHVVRCTYNAATTTIETRVDRARATTSRSDAATPPNTSIAGMLCPSFGALIASSDPPALSSPFFGQLGALVFFNTALSAGDAAPVENYLAVKYGLTLV